MVRKKKKEWMTERKMAEINSVRKKEKDMENEEGELKQEKRNKRTCCLKYYKPFVSLFDCNVEFMKICCLVVLFGFGVSSLPSFDLLASS